jgi:hypothetical protein
MAINLMAKSNLMFRLIFQAQFLMTMLEIV